MHTWDTAVYISHVSNRLWLTSLLVQIKDAMTRQLIKQVRWLNGQGIHLERLTFTWFAENVPYSCGLAEASSRSSEKYIYLQHSEECCRSTCEIQHTNMTPVAGRSFLKWLAVIQKLPSVTIWRETPWSLKVLDVLLWACYLELQCLNESH